MKSSRILLLLGLVAFVCATTRHGYAQQPDLDAADASRVGSTFESAKADAIKTYGILTPVGSDPMVARAIYVKLRRGVSGVDAPSTVRTLANAAGLRASRTTPIPMTQAPLSKRRTAEIQSMNAAEQAAVAEAIADLGRIVELSYDAAIPPMEAARIMARLPQVEYAEPIYLPHTTGLESAPPNDPRRGEQYQNDQVKLTQAWEIWKGDTSYVVAIVDAGIDMLHEDLAPSIQPNNGETGTDARGNDMRTNRIDDDRNGVVDDWRGANLTAGDDGSIPGDTKGGSHGTSVAGYSSAMTNNGIGISGAGYRCRFFPIKTALKNGGNLIRAYEGIVYAAREGHQVINCSFGADSYSQVLQDLISNLIRINDCAIVAAAGNGVLYSNFYPAGYRGILGVGALEPNNSFATTWGEQVDISSPGGFTTNENNTYSNGGTATSFASPVVSGIVALVRSKFPNLKAAQALAHVRLTSDPLPPVTDKVKLTGLGRVNALRAVSTDPFSHPAIMVDTVWLTDDAGVKQDRAVLGRFGRLSLRLNNILGKATNVRVKVVTYNDDASALFIKDTTLLVASLNTDETKEIGGIPFQLRQPNNSRLRFRVEITADGGYNDYHYERTLFYVPYMTYRTPNIAMTLTDRGRIGFDDFPDNSIGDGFTYTSTPFLYEGGIIVASDPVRVLSNVRAGNPKTQKLDFTTAEYPSAANDYTLTLNDAGTGDRRIGLEMRMRVVTVDSIPDGIAIQLRTKNVSNNRLDTLRVAMFFDWDLDNTEVGQSIEYREAPKTNVPFYGLIEGSSGYYLSQGVAREVPLPVFFAIRNDSLPIRLFDGFGDDEKWYTLRNGIGSRRAVMADSSDISLVLGKRIPGMMPGDEDTTLFVIGIGQVQGDAIRWMRGMAPPYKDTSTVGVEEVRAGALLGQISPNPLTGIAMVTVGDVRPDATLMVYDALGRPAADLTQQLARRDRFGAVLFDASSLASGVYQLQIVNGNRTETRRVVLIR